MPRRKKFAEEQIIGMLRDDEITRLEEAVQRGADTLFESMRRIELSAEMPRRAIDLRRQLRLRLPDAIVLATADWEGCILVTRNAKDFDSNAPRVRVPYRS